MHITRVTILRQQNIYCEIHLRFHGQVPVNRAVVCNAMDDCINATTRPLNPPGKIPGTYCTGGWEGLGAGLTGRKNLALIVVQAPDRAARSESLYGLH
jgi:hypothetical protein